MIVTSLFGLFMGAVYESMLIGLRVTSTTDDRAEIVQQAASVLERFVRDVNIADNVDAAQSARFQFDTPPTNNINYVYSSGTLSRSNTVILRNITAFDLNFFDSSGTQLAEPVPGASEDTIRLVQVSVTLTKDSETVSFAQSAYLRNM